MAASTSLRIQQRISLIVTAIGVLLMTGKIIADSEPGLIPLLLVILGSGWWFLARRQGQRARSD